MSEKTTIIFLAAAAVLLVVAFSVGSAKSVKVEDEKVRENSISSLVSQGTNISKTR